MLPLPPNTVRWGWDVEMFVSPPKKYREVVSFLDRLEGLGLWAPGGQLEFCEVNGDNRAGSTGNTGGMLWILGGNR